MPGTDAAPRGGTGSRTAGCAGWSSPRWGCSRCSPSWLRCTPGGWAGASRASRTPPGRAKVAQKQLEAVPEVCPGRRRAGGQAAPGPGEEGASTRAEDAARAPQVRIAKCMPYTRSTVADMDHLLTAADVLVDSADDALTLYIAYSGETQSCSRTARSMSRRSCRPATRCGTMREALSRARVGAEAGRRRRADGRRGAGQEAHRPAADRIPAGRDQAARAVWSRRCRPPSARRAPGGTSSRS